MFERPKRVTSKPTRYMTTSSDDQVSPPKRKAATTLNVGDVQEDIQDIRNTLKEDFIYFNINKSLRQYPSHTSAPSHTYTYTKTNTNQSHVAAQSSHIYAQSDTLTNFQSSGQRDTIVQPHRDNQTYTHTQSYINVQPLCSSSHKTHISQKAQPLTQNYDTQHVEMVNYTDNVSLDLQDQCRNSEAHGDVSSRDWNINIGGSTAHGHHQSNRLTQLEKSDIQKIHELLDRVEKELKRVNSTAEKMLKSVQDRHRAPRKPPIFPIASLPDMDAFERIDEEEYSNVVNYFHFIGGFNSTEAVNICLKGMLEPPIECDKFLHDGVCQNRHFEKPTRSEFQAQMREALRMSKERHRSRSRRNTIPRSGGGGGGDGARIQRRNLWNDEQFNEEDQGSDIND